jgi:hypothetical protein
MKFSRILVLVAMVMTGLGSLGAFAQQVDVKGVDTNADETTITVKKGKGGTTAATTCQPVYQIEVGNEEIVADGAVMTKGARANWKKSCDDWKKEFQTLNKDNKVISMSCGTASCGPEGAETVCKSTANYKVRIKMTE